MLLFLNYQHWLVGVLSSFYGISSAVYSGTYLYIFQQNLEIYMIFCAVLGGVVVMILGTLFLDSNAGVTTQVSKQTTSSDNIDSINSSEESEEIALIKLKLEE